MKTLCFSKINYKKGIFKYIIKSIFEKKTLFLFPLKNVEAEISDEIQKSLFVIMIQCNLILSIIFTLRSSEPYKSGNSLVLVY